MATTTVDDTDVVTIAGVFDTDSFEWGRELLDSTVSWLNSPEGRQSISAPSNTYPRFEWDLENAACDPTTASRAYWKVRNRHIDESGNGNRIHGIIGARCSGASIAIARIAGLEGIPQVSFSSSSAALSDKDEYPYFSRVGPTDNANGQVGAIVKLLRSMCWDTVSIIQTDTDYSEGLANEFKRLWLDKDSDADSLITEDNCGRTTPREGQVVYESTILLNQDNTLDDVSARSALQNFQRNGVNSRIILLLSHDDDAYPILRTAREINFQADTIWVGPDGWVGRHPIDTINDRRSADSTHDWIPPVPGYLGVTPFRNRNDEIYQNFLSFIQGKQAAQGRTDVWQQFPDYAAEYMVDATIALARALVSLSPSERLNGDLVTDRLRLLNFDGVSGNVQFTPEGDRKNPTFTIVNAQGTDSDGLEWIEVGEIRTGIEAVSTAINASAFCFPTLEMDGNGCGLDVLPSDQYPVPKISEKVKVWVPVVMVLISLLLIVLGYRYFRTKEKKDRLRKSVSSMERKLKEMKSIDDQLMNLDLQVQDAKEKQEALIRKRAQLQDWPTTWSDSLDTLVDVLPTEDQYWDVHDRLKETMDDAYISRLWRVQNRPLWTYYSFHSDRLAMHGVTKKKELMVWHGTSKLDPSVIYNDRQDGFMMQFAAQGFWGRGIYFAEKASYSNSYAYKPPSSLLDGSGNVTSGNGLASSWFGGGSSTKKKDTRPDEGQHDEKEMFLATLLVGNEVFMDRNESEQKKLECKNLTVPPPDPKTNLKYNTVSGSTGGSKVYIVYENGRAYPSYLIRYYRGSYDKSRTPFQTRDEAKNAVGIMNDNSTNFSPKKQKSMKKALDFSSGRTSRSSSSTTATATTGAVGHTLTSSTSSSSSSGGMGATVPTQTVQNFKPGVWSFRDNSGWTVYSDQHQKELETAWNAKPDNSVTIKTDQWTYLVDFKSMKQTNVEHPSRRERDVRRKVSKPFRKKK